MVSPQVKALQVQYIEPLRSKEKFPKYVFCQLFICTFKFIQLFRNVNDGGLIFLHVIIINVAPTQLLGDSKLNY